MGDVVTVARRGRRHDGTLDQIASIPAHLIQVGSSVSGNPSYGLGGRVLHDAAVLDDEEMAAPTGPSLASARLDCGGRERGAI